MQYNFLIRNGTVVDGTGAPAYAADVRINDGFITEIGKSLPIRNRERVIDATDCLVTPGFVETHNHYDAPMWWMPNLEPASGYGITTTINGNCGFSAAPVSDDPGARMEMVKIFSFFEDIPAQPFVDELPWDWRKWSEYRASLEKNLQFPVNFAAFVGHLAIRVAVLGVDAWDREASQNEIQRMCDLLRDALDAGALGMSSNMLDYDGKGRPIPTIIASDDEYSALLDVLEEYPDKPFQIIIGMSQRFTAMEDIKRVERLAKHRNLRVLWASLPLMEYQLKHIGGLFDEHERLKGEGAQFYANFHHVPLTVAINFSSSLVFGQSNNLVWSELTAAPDEATKLAMLKDPEWRARARESWDNSYDQSPLKHPEQLLMHESQTGFGPLGITFAEYIGQLGENAHPSDALAEWLIDNGFDSSLMMQSRERSRERVVQLNRDPFAIGNVSDSGAHGQMLCGIGDHISLLTDYVRDNQLLTIEEGIHNLTGKLANFFGLRDRGELKVGKVADVVVFKLDEIERRPTIKIFDVPNGKGGRTWRYSREAAPVRLTLVNGIPTFDRERYTGNAAGKVITTAAEVLPLAEAAE